MLGEPCKSVDGKSYNMPSCLYGGDSYDALNGCLGDELYNRLGLL